MYLFEVNKVKKKFIEYKSIKYLDKPMLRFFQSVFILKMWTTFEIDFFVKER